MSQHHGRRARLNVEQMEDRLVPSATDFVKGLYTDVLHRAGADSEVNAWVQLMNAGLSGHAVVQGFVQSDEHRGQQIEAIYQTALGRGADSAGKNHWLLVLRAGVDIADVERSILLSAEFQNAHSSNTAFVSANYQAILGRTADNFGLLVWKSSLDNGLSRDAFIKILQLSPENLGNQIDVFYLSYLHRTPSSGDRAFWIEQASSGRITLDQEAVDFLSSVEYESGHGFDDPFGHH